MKILFKGGIRWPEAVEGSDYFFTEECDAKQTKAPGSTSEQGLASARLI